MASWRVGFQDCKRSAAPTWQVTCLQPRTAHRFLSMLAFLRNRLADLCRFVLELEGPAPPVPAHPITEAGEQDASRQSVREIGVEVLGGGAVRVCGKNSYGQIVTSSCNNRVWNSWRRQRTRDEPIFTNSKYLWASTRGGKRWRETDKLRWKYTSTTPADQACATTELADGRGQAFFVVGERLRTTWMRHNGKWSPNQTISPRTIATSVSAIRLPCGRTQVWFTDDRGNVWTIWKLFPRANSPWTSASRFSTPARVKQIATAPTVDGGVQVWIVGRDGILYQTEKPAGKDPTDWMLWRSQPLYAVRRVLCAVLDPSWIGVWAVDGNGNVWKQDGSRSWSKTWMESH